MQNEQNLDKSKFALSLAQLSDSLFVNVIYMHLTLCVVWEEDKLQQELNCQKKYKENLNFFVIYFPSMNENYFWDNHLQKTGFHSPFSLLSLLDMFAFFSDIFL